MVLPHALHPGPLRSNDKVSLSGLQLIYLHLCAGLPTAFCYRSTFGVKYHTLVCWNILEKDDCCLCFAICSAAVTYCPIDRPLMFPMPLTCPSFPVYLLSAFMIFLGPTDRVTDSHNDVWPFLWFMISRSFDHGAFASSRTRALRCGVEHAPVLVIRVRPFIFQRIDGNLPREKI